MNIRKIKHLPNRFPDSSNCARNFSLRRKEFPLLPFSDLFVIDCHTVNDINNIMAILTIDVDPIGSINQHHNGRLITLSSEQWNRHARSKNRRQGPRNNRSQQFNTEWGRGVERRSMQLETSDVIARSQEQKSHTKPPERMPHGREVMTDLCHVFYFGRQVNILMNSHFSNGWWCSRCSMLNLESRRSNVTFSRITLPKIATSRIPFIVSIRISLPF